MDPSPTADATRLIFPALTSPTAQAREWRTAIRPEKHPSVRDISAAGAAAGWCRFNRCEGLPCGSYFVTTIILPVTALPAAIVAPPVSSAGLYPDAVAGVARTT